MKVNKSFKHALNMVLHSRLRSWLTILGIVIGVAAVISIVSLGQGLQQQVGSQLNSLGADIATVTAGSSRAARFGPGGGGFDFGGSATATKTPVVLNIHDLQTLKGVSGVKYVDTEISGSSYAVNQGENGTVRITGVNPAVWPIITTLTVSKGRLLGPADSNSVVVGGRFATSFFTKQLGINQMINIGGKSFRIVGILNDQSTEIYMPIDAAYTVLTSKTKGDYDSLVVKVADSSSMNATINSMTQALANERHVSLSKPDFSITNPAQIEQQRSSIFSSMTTFLTAIAAVALLVGAVGIANTMFTSVLERTKQIGIMKAIGAKNHDILMMFMFNAAIIGFIGGALGIVLGTLFSGFLPVILGSSGGILGRLSSGSVVSTTSIIMALIISVGIGVIAGFIPALQASKLKPVDALRFE